MLNLWFTLNWILRDLVVHSDCTNVDNSLWNSCWFGLFFDIWMNRWVDNSWLRWTFESQRGK
jgi:hypothetical protein